MSPDYPEHWSAPARDTYDAVLEQRPDLAGAEFSALVQAGDLITSADGLDAAARQDGMLARGSTGQVVVHPALVEARLARTAASAILARLVPATAGPKTASQRGRDAARARHGR
jgi:hypothetical protein